MAVTSHQYKYSCESKMAIDKASILSRNGTCQQLCFSHISVWEALPAVGVRLTYEPEEVHFYQIIDGTALHSSFPPSVPAIPLPRTVFLAVHVVCIVDNWPDQMYWTSLT